MKSINVVAAIIVKDKKVFATRRGYGEYTGGWEFPGGKIEPGESPEEALEREIEEELDADIEVGELLTIAKHDYGSFFLNMRCYICTLRKDHIVLLEHSAAKWLDADSLDTLNWLPADIQVVEAIRRYGIL